MYTLSLSGMVDGCELSVENQVCLSELVWFDGDRSIQELELGIYTSRPYVAYEPYVDWVVRKSFLSRAFKHPWTAVNGGVKVRMDVDANFNINYYLGAMIMLRHVFEFPDWGMGVTDWDVDKFNQQLQKEVVRPTNHLVYNRFSPVTTAKIASVSYNKHFKARVTDNFSRKDIKVKQFFNNTVYGD